MDIINNPFAPDRVLNTVGMVIAGYGIIASLSGRMDRWMAAGYIAVGQFLVGLSATAEGNHGSGALLAGLSAFHGYLWWTGGGSTWLLRRIERARNDAGR